MPITETFRRLWQKDAEFKARMGYIARHCCKRKQGRLEKKWTKDLNTYFSEDTKMANKHVKRWLIVTRGSTSEPRGSTCY